MSGMKPGRLHCSFARSSLTQARPRSSAGPPGTGKTLVAKRLAHTSGLDYAILSGGDVAPLGTQAVQEIHSTFDWARRSPKGMVLFVDEADAFLSHRGKSEKSEAMRSAINAMLYRTGDQNQDFMVILATNRPGAPPVICPASCERVAGQRKGL
jgi:SpoVK/Ycf46/Vps4 family AAA+-type ATPase